MQSCMLDLVLQECVDICTDNTHMNLFSFIHVFALVSMMYILYIDLFCSVKKIFYFDTKIMVKD